MSDMNYFPLMIVGGVAGAGLVAYVAHRVGDARRRGGRGGRPTLSSIPEGVGRAKRARRRVLVAFVSPGEARSEALLDFVLGARELDSTLRHFELVKIDSREEDREVVAHLAQKYGIASLALPALLALDVDGKKVGSLEGGDAVPEKVEAFVKMVRPGG